MGSSTFTAIDFETANPKRGSVCAIGVAKFDLLTGQLVASDGGLVTPPAGLDEFNGYNMRVHHISPRKIRQARNGAGAATWSEVLPWLIRFVGDDLVLAHNAPFERSVLRAASEAVQLEVPAMADRVFCTVKMAKRELPGLDKHKLPMVIDALGLPSMGETHHDALPDALACGRIAVSLMQRTGSSLAELIQRSGQHELYRQVQRAEQRKLAQQDGLF